MFRRGEKNFGRAYFAGNRFLKELLIVQPSLVWHRNGVMDVD